MREIRLRILQRQIDRLGHRIDQLNTLNDQYSQVRVAVFAVGALASLVAFYALIIWLGLVLMGLTVVAFASVVYVHRQFQDSLTRHQLWQRIKQTHLARMTLDWDNIPASPDRVVIAQHPFEIDLNLTGPRSLHQLIDTSLSNEGSQRLRDWLLNTTPDADEIWRRQAIGREIKPLTRFRDRLLLHARQAAKGSERRIEGQRVLDWFAQRPTVENLQSTVLLASSLVAANIALFVLFTIGALPPLWLVPFSIYVLLWGRHWRVVGEMFTEALAVYYTFNRLQAVFGYLETYNYDRYPHLKTVCQPFLDNPPSWHVRRVTRILTAASLQQNPFVWFALNMLLPWDLYFAHRLNRSKADIAALMPSWLDAWFELEALNSLANFAYLNPDYVEPELVEGTWLQADQLGHPLVQECVANSFMMDQVGSVVIITGSNMSGKSTFLRTIGVALVLTYSGAVVHAQRLQVSLMRLYTCIKISDSLNDGISYFYAEVKRLKGLLDALDAEQAIPVFFLIDEIFRGTNNRERLEGSRAYIKALVKRNGLGLLATHDLELVRLADDIPDISNFHFREEIREGRMVFDYTIRSGPSPTTNALKIMALEGLPVD